MTKWARVVIAMLAVSCGDDDRGGVERTTVIETPAVPYRDLDLLFVIDNSLGMVEHQENIIPSFPAFVDALSNLPGGMPNLHLGVVTTDMGTSASGSAQTAPQVGQVGSGGCAGTGDAGHLQLNGAPVDGAYLSDIEENGERVRNYTGELADVFATMATVGATGCGFEQPLRAMRAALDDHPANAGFLREHALLGVVILADEDDCSVTSLDVFGPESPTLGPQSSFRCTRFGVTCTNGGATPDEMNQPGVKTGCGASTTSPYLDPVAPYRDFLVGLKGGDASRVAVAAVMADPEPIEIQLLSTPGGGTPVPTLSNGCTAETPQGPATANPAPRLQSFLELFPNRAGSVSICQQDLSGGLALFGELMKEALGYPCLDPAELADTDPATPGIQYDCVAEDVLGATVTEIAPCGPGAPATCWSLEASPTVCPGPEQRTLVVTRPSTPPGGTITRLRCVTP